MNIFNNNKKGIQLELCVKQHDSYTVHIMVHKCETALIQGKEGRLSQYQEFKLRYNTSIKIKRYSIPRQKEKVLTTQM